MEQVRIYGTEPENDVSETGEPVVFIHGLLIADTFRPRLAEPHLADRDGDADAVRSWN